MDHMFVRYCSSTSNNLSRLSGIAAVSCLSEEYFVGTISISNI